VIGWFITGTDTGVGKTHVAAGLCRGFAAAGIQTMGFKPIETGVGDPSQLGDDQSELVRAAGGWQVGAARGPYRLRRPASPYAAALTDGVDIDLDAIVKLVAGTTATCVIAEGAGGWRVPITASADMSTLAQRLGLPVIVVARATLGTINHTTLTVEAVTRDGCKVAAVVLSRRPNDDLAFSHENATEIRRLTGLDSVVVLERDASPLLRLLESKVG